MKYHLFEKLSPRSVELFTYATLSIGAFSLLVLEAIYVPPTQDEVTSFFDFAIGDNSRLLLTESNNNHLLNTLLGKLSLILFGDSMTVFRLPNVLSYLLWLTASWKLTTTLSPILRWSLLMAFLFCYPLFEYFALARGYGLSFAFLILQVYFLIRYQANPTTKILWSVCIATALAVFSHLTLLNEALLTFLTLVLLLLYNKAWSWKNTLPLVLLFSAIAFTAKLGASYKSIIQFYFNQSEGFIETTVGSLFHMFADSIHHWQSVILFGLPLLFAITLVCQFVVRFSWQQVVESTAVLVTVLFFGNVCCTILLSALFEVHYPTERVALYFIPLYLLFVSFCLDSHRSNRKWLRIPLLVSAISIPMYFVFDFIESFNHDRSRVEPYAHLPKAVFNAIDSDNEKSGFSNSPIVSGDERLAHAWRYYAFKEKVSLNNWIDQHDYDASNYVILHDSSDEYKPIYSSVKDGVFVYKGGLVLLPLSLKTKPKSSVKEEYVGIHYNLSFRSNRQPVSLNCNVELNRPGRTVLYTVLKNQEGVELYSHTNSIDQLLVSKNAEVHPTWVFPECDSCILNIFLYNIDKRTVTVSELPPQTKAP